MTQFQTPVAELFFTASGSQPAPAAIVVAAFARTGRRAAARTGRDVSRRTAARRTTRCRKTIRRAA
jgi:hypothetical protein